jgi:peptidoglycan/xylan/chitin deacetylase (PgdA/CDA1 family)
MIHFQTFIRAFIILLLGALALWSLGWIGGWVAGVLVTAGIVFVFIKSLTIQSDFFIQSFSGLKKTQSKVVSLTFDDGPHPATLSLLDLLDKYQVKATFFCIGKQIEKHPEIFQKILVRGHSVGNHTYTHSPVIGFLSSASIQREIQHTDNLFKQYGAHSCGFRPPFGVLNPHIAQAVKTLGQQVIGWNVRSLDTCISDEKKLFHRVQKRIQPGSVVLFHDTSLKTVNVVEQLLLFLKAENYTLITIDKMLDYEI